MRRRDFIALLAAATATTARAQQPTLPVVGFLRSPRQGRYEENLRTVLSHGLKETGLVEGQNVAIDYRSADSRVDRLPALAAELIQRPVAVVVADNVAAIAAK